MSWSRKLQQKAEELISTSEKDFKKFEFTEIKQVLHNLQVQQIELELQNDELMKTQQDLILSRDSFSNLYHYAPISYVALDKNAMILHVNHRFLEKMDMQESDVLEKPFAGFVEDKYRDIFWSRFKAFFNRPENKSFELKMLTNHEKPFYARIQAAYLPDALIFFHLESEEKIILVTIQDITNELEKESALRQSESKYRYLFENAPIGIISIDVEGKILEVNQKLVDILGSPSQEETLAINMFSFKPLIDAGITEKFKQCIKSQKAMTYETHYTSKWGKVIYVRFNLIPILNEQGVCGVQSTVEDISDKKQVEIQREALLDEKDVLLREIHHRVKNNFSLISSLIFLQTRSISDQTVLDFFTIIHNRIRTMALVHENLYRYESLSEINMDNFFDQLVNGIVKSYNVNDREILTNINCSDILLNINHAIPCGLMVNELITNSLKYAFPPDFKHKPILKIALLKNGEQYCLIVEDNGIGIPDSYDFQQIDTFGMQIVHLLGEKQLNGKLEINRKAPTRFQLTFK